LLEKSIQFYSFLESVTCPGNDGAFQVSKGMAPS